MEFDGRHSERTVAEGRSYRPSLSEAKGLELCGHVIPQVPSYGLSSYSWLCFPSLLTRASSPGSGEPLERSPRRPAMSSTDRFTVCGRRAASTRLSTVAPLPVRRCRHIGRHGGRYDSTARALMLT